MSQSEVIENKVFTQNEMSKYYIDKWYSDIQQFTFKTVFISLNIETAKSIIAYHHQRYGNDNDTETKDEQKTTESDTDSNEILVAYETLIKQINSNKNLQLEQDDGKWIKQLNEEIGHKLDECKQLWNINKFFMRLSNRSSKDGDKIYRNIGDEKHNKYDKYLKQLQDENENDNDLVNLQMIACMKCIYDEFWIDNSDDAVSLLLSSKRIYFDLINHLIVYYSDKDNNEWNINIAIREFNDNLCDELEFRCFVYNSELTAISQYNKYCYYHKLKENKDEIESVLINYWLKIAKYINYTDYVVDIALIEKMETELKFEDDDNNDGKYECIVIEINPFSELTSCCLFDWSIDKYILKGSDIGEIVFRIYEDKDKFIKYSMVNENTVNTLLKRYDAKFDEIQNISWIKYLEQMEHKKKKNCIIL